MKTDKETLDNLKKGIVTEKMLGLAIFSYNKRAKNMRDKESEYRNYFRRNWYAHDIHDNVGKYQEKKENYYNRKDECLSFLKPTSLHSVKRERTYRKYDDDFEYFEYVTEKFTEYYAVYRISTFSFHHPIEKTEFNKLSETLPMAKLLDLQTEGEKVEKLMSVQTADKIRNGLKDGTLKLVMDDKEVDQSSPSSM